VVALLDAFDRVLWLLVVPLLAAVAPWLLLGVLHASRQEGGFAARAVAAALPLVGAVCVHLYAWSKLTLRSVLPLFPYAALALCFCALLLVDSVNRPVSTEDLPTWRAIVESLGVLVAFLLPITAVVGGALSLQSARRLVPW